MAEKFASAVPNLMSFESWLAHDGTAEYVEYRKKATPPLLDYDDWAASEFPLGLYLYRLTLDVWDEATSSDNDLEEHVKSASAGQAERLSIKAATINGNGQSHAIDVSTLKAEAQGEELGTSPKKRRRQKKKYLSAAVISPEDFDDSAASEAQVNELGASTKKPRQKRKSKLNAGLTPEDVEELSSLADATVGTDEPDGPNATSAPRRGLRTRTAAQQRPYFHNAKQFEDADPEKPGGATNDDPSPQQLTKLAHAIQASSEDELSDEQMAELDELPIRQPRGPKKFKGPGRAWKKDEDEEDDDYTAKGPKPKKRGRPRKSKDGQAHGPSQPRAKTEENEDNSGPLETVSTQKRAKPKRASRQSYLSQELVADDSDPMEVPVEDSTMIEEATIGIQRRQRRPRKSYISEEFVRDDSESVKADSVKVQGEAKEDTQGVENPDGIEEQLVPSAYTQKTKRRSRKSYISEEFVRDSSDAEEEQNEDNPIDAESEINDLSKEEPPTATLPFQIKQARKAPRPRKSHLSEEFVHSDSDSVAGAQEESHDFVEATPNKKSAKPEGSPLLSSKRSTPRGRPKKSEAIVLDDSSEEDNVNVVGVVENTFPLAGKSLL